MSTVQKEQNRHCERSEAISIVINTINCFVVTPRNDEVLILR